MANPWRVWKGKWKTKSSADESWIEDGNFDSRNWLEMAPGDGYGPLNWPKWMGSELELAGSYQARGEEMELHLMCVCVCWRLVVKDVATMSHCHPLHR